MKQFACFLLSFALLFSACSKDEDVADPDEGQKEPVVEEKVVPVLTSFVFEASKNAQYLIKDIECTIKDSTITALIPYVTEISELIPTFEGVYDKVSIGNTVQRSGLTTNDYSKEIVYTVSTKDTTIHYTVTVFCFTGLPIVNIETDNRQDITSKEDYVYGTMTISKTADYSYYATEKAGNPGIVEKYFGTRCSAPEIFVPL